MKSMQQALYPASYYLRAFKRLDEAGQCDFNWSAAIFGSFWALYRKIYLGALPMLVSVPISVMFAFDFFAVVCKLMQQISGQEISAYKTTKELNCFFYTGGAFLIYQIMSTLLYGKYGNKLYYEQVKKRISRGYHLVTDISATIPPAVIALITCSLPFISFWIIMLYLTLMDVFENKTHPSTIHIILAIAVTLMLIICLYSKIDKMILNKFKKKNELQDTQISEENIKKYLLRNNSNKYFKIFNIGLMLPPLISLSLVLYTFVKLYFYSM